MISEEADEEIEKLKVKELELVAKSNLTNDFTEKEDLEDEIGKIKKQIETLEKLKLKS